MKRPDLDIGSRLALGFGVVLALVASILVSSFVWYDQVSALERRLEHELEPSARAASALDVAALERSIWSRRFAITRDPAHLVAAGAAAGRVRAALGDMLSREPAGASVTALSELTASYLEESDRLIAAATSGDDPEILAAEDRMAEVRERLSAAIARVSARHADEIDAARDDVATARRALVTRTAIGSLLALLSAVVVAVLTTVSVRVPAKRLVHASRRLAAGDYAPALALAPRTPAPTPGRDELRELTSAFGGMAAALRERERRLAAEARLAGTLARSVDLGEIAREALGEVVAHAGAEIGAVYALRDDAPTLDAVATFALGDLASLQPGDGIPGEAFASGRTLRVDDLPADAPFRIRLGFDELPPRCLVAAPIPFQGRPVGVLVVGSVRPLPGDACEFVEAAAARIGVGLRNAAAHQRTARLAADLQQRNEELHAQNEEIQAQSEEIQAQSEELHAQNEEMQAQGEELQAQNGELQALTAELRHRTDALACSDRLKDEFLAALSHELRNPLAAISASVQQLDSADPGRAAQRRKVIAHQTGRLTRIVDDLLDVTRIAKGKLELRRTTLDLAEVVAGAVDAAAHAYAAAGVTLALAPHHPRPLPLEGDGARLEQVMENLLSNALKFTPQGGRVDVSIVRSDREAVIRVRDTGAGIPPDIRPRVFDLFFQGARAQGRHQHGLGVGLSLVRRLVEMHGGAVTCTSEPGCGAEFVVRLPALPASKAITGPVRPPARECAPARALRILVIEDNVDFAAVLEDAVTGWGHAVEVAHRAADGLARALAATWDLVLLDIGLPDLDGYAVARKLREAQARPSCLVAMTGYGRPEDAARATEAGFDLHLVKPVDLDRIQAVIAEVATAPEQAAGA